MRTATQEQPCCSTLLALAANTIANCPRVLGAVSHLSLTVGAAVFSAFRQQWIAEKRESLFDLEQLFIGYGPIAIPLVDCDLSATTLNDSLLVDLLKAHEDRLQSIDLTDVKGLTDGGRLRKLLNDKRVQLNKLRVLSLNSCAYLFDSTTTDNVIWSQSLFAENDPQLSFESSDTATANDESFTSRCPNLQSLTLCNCDIANPNDILLDILAPLKQLAYLNLSNWRRVDGLRCLLPHSLTALILHNVPDLEDAIDAICQLSQLRCLDVSQTCVDMVLYIRPATSLFRLITSLPLLDYLDISSTNLASPPSYGDNPSSAKRCCDNIRSDIFGLRFLTHRLKFLGLLNCNDSSHYAEIPAEQVTGGANEAQIILSLRVYQQRPGLLSIAMNESYTRYAFAEHVQQQQRRHCETLQLVLHAMNNNGSDKYVQSIGSALVSYIIPLVDMDYVTKRRVVKVLLNAIESHMNHENIIINCCLSLEYIVTPEKLLADDARSARLFLNVLATYDSEGDQHVMQQSVALQMLILIAADNKMKDELRSLDALEIVVQQIRLRYAAANCDWVMEACWGFLWQMTDENAINCERIVDNGTLQLFHQCYSAFANQTALVEQLFGFLSNIAEVVHLHSQLMNEESISIFCSQLDNVHASFETRYDSASILANLLIDAGWPSSIDRQTVTMRMHCAIARWSFDASVVRYNSLRPLIRLLPFYDSPASQHWAAWALANITSANAEKYCRYFVDEGGMHPLRQIIADNLSTFAVKRLANIIIDQIVKWRGETIDPIDVDDIVQNTTTSLYDEHSSNLSKGLWQKLMHKYCCWR